MFESMTVETIKAGILAEIAAADNPPSTREGSFAETVAAGAASEIYKLYQSLNAVVPIAFVDDSSGGYIDLEGEKYNIPRKSGTKAAATVHLTGTAGATIPQGTAFATADRLAFYSDTAVTLDGTGAGDVPVTAEVEGAAYNVDAGAIDRMFVNLAAVKTITGGAAAGGTDEETDSALFTRISARMQAPATSGNAYHYEQWALEVDGVGKVQVLPLANGPGTVTVLVADSNLEPAAAAIVAAVAAHIEEERPIGAAVTVAAPEALSVTVAATVTIDGTTDLATVQTALEGSLSAYLKGLVFDAGTILYNRVAYLLLSIDGVTDYSALTVNDGTANVSIPAGSIPVLGAVTVT